jgi:rod shape-determining protein MreD
MENKLTISRYIIGVIIVLFYEVIIAPRIRIAGIEADLAIIMTVWIAMNHGSRSGLFFGFIIGFLTGVFNPMDIGWSCLFLGAIGYIAGLIKNKLVIEPIPMKLLMLAISTLVYNSIMMIFTSFGLLMTSFSYVIYYVLFSTLYTAIIGCIIFYIIRYRYALRKLF